MIHSIKSLLSQAAQQAPSADNSQPWLLYWQGNTLSIRYDSERVGKKTFPENSPATLLSIGAVIENLNQAAKAHRVKISWNIAEQIDKNNPVYCHCHISTTDDVKIFDNLLPLYERNTNRLPYLSTPLPIQQLEVLKKLTLGTIRVKVFQSHEEIGRTAQLVRFASEIRFRTHEINEWLGKSLRFGKQAKSCGDGLDVATLDLPPGGTLFLKLISNWQRMKWLNLLGAYKFMSFIDSLPVKKAPALVAIIGPKGFHEYLSAGQLMQRIWIDLNAQGIAVHPYYVIADQINRFQGGKIPRNLIKQATQTNEEAIQLFELNEGETLHMLFRIGYPKKKAKRSKRLPLEVICHDQD